MMEMAMLPPKVKNNGNKDLDGGGNDDVKDDDGEDIVNDDDG